MSDKEKSQLNYVCVCLYAHTCMQPYVYFHMGVCSNWRICEHVLCVGAFLNIQLRVCAYVCVFFYSNFPFRYKLFRRKTHQPLAIATVPPVTAMSPPPSEDLHRWLHVYSGTKLFYQDKGLSR